MIHQSNIINYIIIVINTKDYTKVFKTNKGYKINKKDYIEKKKKKKDTLYYYYYYYYYYYFYYFNIHFILLIKFLFFFIF